MNKDELLRYKGLKSLSPEERSTWEIKNKERFANINSLSYKDREFIKSQVYLNDLYKEEFGKEEFAKNPDFESRRLQLLEKKVEDIYGSDPNYAKISNLTEEGLYELSESNYRNTEEIEKYRNQGTSTNINQGFSPISRTISNLKNYDKQTSEYWANVMEEGNSEILQSIYNKDLQRKAADTSSEAAAYSDNFYRGLQSGKLTHEYIDKLFDDLTQGTEYTLRKDSKEFADFNQTDKIQYLSKMMGLINKYGEEDAINLLGADLQNYAQEHMSGGQKVTNLWREFYTSVTSEAMNEVLALKNAWNLVSGDLEELDANLNGKTKEGEDLKNIWNPQYWQSVKQYNTHSADEIDKIRQSGGITPYKNITRSGEEYEIFNLTNIGNSLSEGVGQAAVMTTQALLFKGLGSISSAALGTTGKAASFAAGAIAVIETGLPALGGAHAESYEAYQNTVLETKEKIDKFIDDKVNRRIQEYLLSKESVASFDSLLETKKRLAKEQGKMYLDEDALVQETYQEYVTNLAKNYRHFEEQSEEVQNLKEEATSAALTAYGTALTISTLKNAGAIAALRKVFLSKGTQDQIDDILNSSVPKTTGGQDGTLQAGKFSTFSKHIKPYAKPFFGEGLDEWLDVVINNGAQNFGIAGFNDYLTQEVDPDNYNEVLDNGFNHLLRAFTDLPEDIFTKEALFEAGMGAFSGALRITPNMGLLFDKNRKIRGQSFRTDAKGNKISLAEALSKYMSNEMLQEKADINRREREYNADINAANITIESHKKDLELLGKTISTLSDYSNYQTVDALEVADKKGNNVIQLAFAINDLQQGQFTSMSPVVQKALEDIEKMASGNLSEEETNTLIDEFLNNPNNKSLSYFSNPREEALTRLKKNAEQFQQIRETINTRYAELNKSKKTRNISDYAKKQIIFSELQEKDWESRFNTLASNIGVHKNISIGNEFNVVGSREAYHREGQVIIENQKTLIEQKESLEATIKSLKDKMGVANKEEKMELALALKMTEGALQQTENKLMLIDSDLKHYAEKDDYFNENEYSETFSIEEILSLPAKERARILDDRFLGDYSVEQRIIINDAKNELLRRDLDALIKIEDMAILADRINAIKESRAKMYENPEHLSSYIAAAQKYRENKLKDSAYKRAQEKVLERLESLDDNALLQQANIESVESLQLFIEAHPEKEEILKPKIQLAKLKKDKGAIIFNMYPDKSSRGKLSSALSPFIKNANTVEEYMSGLENALDSSSIDPLLKQDIEKVLQQLVEIDYQRDATKVQSREEKKKREEELNKKREVENNKKEGAVKKAEEAKKEESATTIETTLGEDIDIEEEVLEETSEEISKETTEEIITAEEANTPTIQEEVAKDKDAVIIPTTPSIDKDPKEETFKPTTLLGNVMYRYNGKKLVEDGTLERRTGKEETDSMSKFFRWLDAFYPEYQDVIDNELHRILEANPKIQLMMVNPNGEATNDKDVQDYVFNVVEYTDKVARIHKSDKGVIISNGKKYLIIGVSGFGNTESQKTFQPIQEDMKVRRHSFLKNNSTERFYVDQDYNTEALNITRGIRVRSLDGEEFQYRTMGELLSESRRNPKKLSIEDLKWGIMTDTGMYLIGVSERNKVIHPQINSNVGNVFLLLQSGNGDYIPIYVKPTNLTELREGKLKDEIMSLINTLASPNIEDRIIAREELRKLVYLDSDNNINIGNKNSNTVSIKKNGVVVKTFNLDDPSFNRMELIEAINDLNPRINITKDVLSSKDKLKQYDSAGAIVTDIAKLGTSNVSYSTYSMDKQGNPIKLNEVSNENSPKTADSEYVRKQHHSVQHLGQVYRERNGEFYPELSREKVTDPLLIEQLRALQTIRSNNLSPVFEKEGYKYYLISQDSDNPIAYKVVKGTNVVTKADKEQTQKLLERIIEENKKKAAEEELQRLENQEKNTDNAVTVESMEDIENSIEEKPEITFNIRDINSTDDSPIISSETKASYNLSDVLNTDYGYVLDDIIEEKIENGTWEDVPDETSKLSLYLQNKGIQVIGITDVNSWLQEIRECK